MVSEEAANIVRELVRDRAHTRGGALRFQPQPTTVMLVAAAASDLKVVDDAGYEGGGDDGDDDEATASDTSSSSHFGENAPHFALSSLCHVADEELEVLDDDQLVLLSNKFKRVYENRRNRRRADGCFNCEGSSDSSDSDAEDEAPKKKTDGLCFIADADVDGGICTMALEDDAATDNNNNDKSSDDELLLKMLHLLLLNLLNVKNAQFI
ncbi:hypothetical protein E2562_035579 [Oryza meyeriana var. granulata]|uniref:Uncharacterized protein n=1 Tax=Oryza meyeriana var. granulata TaxID=110450 RepID=A0A6G1CB04_9ORYZ|nr:hypothetical protein E2562_035579 [Oryza meyeriana var. granulata]